MSVKCQNCGGEMSYDIRSKNLKCEYCKEKIPIEEYIEGKKSEVIENEDTNTVNIKTSTFQCSECGAEFESYSESATIFCPYCNKQTFLKYTKDEERPIKIIPFSKTKSDMRKYYAKYLEKKKFVPEEFKNPDNLNNFNGIYIPYHNVSTVAPKEMSFFGTKNYSQGSYDYHEEYDVNAEVDGEINNISFDASEALDDTISSQISPFNENKMEDFNEGYVAGFYMDKANVSIEKYSDKIQEISETTLKNEIEKGSKFIKIQNPKEEYMYEISSKKQSLFPVWFMTYKNKDRIGYITGNGQSGKMTMDIPVDTKAFFKFAGILSLILGIVSIFLFSTFFASFSASSVARFSSLFFCVASVVLFIEMNTIYKKDNHFYDVGSKNFKKKLKKKKKQKNGGLTKQGKIVLIIFVSMFFVLPFVFQLLILCFSAFKSFFALASIAIGIILITKLKGKTDNSTKLCFMYLIISGIICFATISIISPANDMYYYGLALFNFIGIVCECMTCIKGFNNLTTRPIPNFFTREGANN